MLLNMVLAMLVVAVAAADSTRPIVHWAPTFDIENQSDVVYGRGLQCADANQDVCEPIDLVLDVTSPTVAPESPRPAVILMHGGGWTGGSKTDGWARASSVFYASRGFVCFSIKYRLEKDHGSFPTRWQLPKVYPATRDLKAAIRFVRANALRFSVDPERIALSGGSAGAISSVAAGVVDEGDYKDELLATDPTLATTYLNTSSAVQLVLSHWGAGYAELLVQAADPSNRSRYSAQSAPIIEFHGDKDNSVPFADALAVQAAYQEANSSGNLAYEMHVLEGLGHAAWCAGCDNAKANGKCAVEGTWCHAMDATALPAVARHLGLDLQGPSPSPAPVPVPSPPAPSPSGDCPAWCENSIKAWSVKCGWVACTDCAKCQGLSEHFSVPARRGDAHGAVV